MNDQATQRAGVETNEDVLSPQRRRDAEIGAEKTESKPRTNSAPPRKAPLFCVSDAFSALISASLRLCGEWTSP
jgi:hypothetical protein